MPLGIIEDGTWEHETTQLDPGDVLVLYSDCITETQNEQEAFFDTGRMQEVQNAVLAEVRNFVGDALQFDDMTLMVVIRDLAEARVDD